jgi:hypothetical protein
MFIIIGVLLLVVRCYYLPNPRDGVTLSSTLCSHFFREMPGVNHRDGLFISVMVVDLCLGGVLLVVAWNYLGDSTMHSYDAVRTSYSVKNVTIRGNAIVIILTGRTSTSRVVTR